MPRLRIVSAGAIGTVTAAATAVLAAAAPADKLQLTHATAAAWRAGQLTAIGQDRPLDHPARPAAPPLVAPGAVPRRKIGRGVAGRFALIHALAHIELNAIDLAWDIIARFAAPRLPRDFVTDWIIVATEEAKHFALLAGRLDELGGCYGDLPAHDGLWGAALATRDDLTARLAVVPLVLEARGLDVTPAMIAKLETVGDDRSAAILRTIYRDEIAHVATGVRWFQFACAAAGWEPASAWRRLVRHHFRGALKPPFNDAARAQAGMPPAFYRQSGR